MYMYVYVCSDVNHVTFGKEKGILVGFRIYYLAEKEKQNFLITWMVRILFDEYAGNVGANIWRGSVGCYR